jgi:DNA-binding beta-propeller fold protein YncE
VGSYNFFNSGTLTADTTISFANVPTNARWSYSFEPITLNGAWDVTKARYVRSFFVKFQEASPQDIFLKPDGTKLYLIGNNGDDVNEYDLGTPWDVSSAIFLQSFSVAGQDTDPRDVFFKPDGTKMYVVGSQVDEINEYDLSTAWDVSTASHLQAINVSSLETNPSGLFFKPDGTRMYFIGSGSGDVREFSLSTAWDISTGTLSRSFTVTSQDSNPKGISFKPDGTKMYIIGITNDYVFEYDLSTAWDVTTASFLQSFDVVLDSAPLGLFFKPDGSRLYVMAETNKNVLEFHIGTASSLSLPSSVSNSPQALVANTRVTYDFFTMDGGTTVTLIGEEVI